MNRSRWIAAMVVGLVLVSIGVGVAQRDSSSIRAAATEATSDAARSSQEAADSQDQRGLPDFDGELFGGGSLSSEDIETPAVIHVYGSWCSTCQGEAPAFAQVQRKHPDLSYYYVAVEDDEEATASFIERYGWKSAPTIDDSARDVETTLGLSGQPHTIFVAADGAITVHRGPGSFGDLNMLAEQIA